MPKVLQNVVLLLDPMKEAWDVSYKAGMMYFNRFCIDEDAAFESTGVYHLKLITSDDLEDRLALKEKGQRKSHLFEV